MKAKLTDYTLLSLMNLIVIITCLDIPIIIGYFSLLMFALRIILLLGFLPIYLCKFKKWSYSFRLISLFFILILFVTIIRGNSIVYALQELTSSYLIALYLEMYRDKMTKILGTWQKVLLVLLICDLGTMIIFPNGLYRTLYDVNWFLGYKTQRFVYYLPLCLISTFLSKKNGKTGLSSYAIILLCMLGLYKSKATAALACIAFIGLCCVILDMKGKFSHSKKILYKIVNYKIFIPAFGIIAYLLVVVQDSAFLQYIVQNVFKKDATLTTRTEVWNIATQEVMKTPILGKGLLTTKQYSEMFLNDYATSAHNMYLSILITSGLVGMVIYAAAMITALRRKDGVYQDNEVIMVFGIMACLIVGMTSSTVVFSSFAFLPFMVLAAGRPQKKTVSKRMLSPVYKRA